MRLILCILLFMVMSVDACADNQRYPSDAKAAIQEIDNLLKDGGAILNRRIATVDSLCRLGASEGVTDAKLQLMEKIVNAYTGFNNDSLVFYCDHGIDLARELGDSMAMQRFSLLLAEWYPTTGVMKEAVERFEAEIARGIYPANRRLAYDAGSRLYVSIASYYPTQELTSAYLEKGRAYLDSLYHSLPSGAPYKSLVNGVMHFLDGDVTLAKAAFIEVIDNPYSSDYEVSRASGFMGKMLDSQNEKAQSLYYYALAALANTRIGDTSGWSFESLGNALFSQGDVKHAYDYLNIALDNAVTSGSKMRAVRIAENMPPVTEAYKSHDRAVISWLIVLAIALTLALAAIGVMMWLLRRDNMGLRSSRSRLSDSNSLKESSITQFLHLCIIALERLDDLSKMARRKISAGQVDDLYAQLKSGTFVNEQNQIVYEKFDEAFLNVYPTFVKDVNRLLEPDKQLPSPSGHLSTEMRVLAFMRLGVLDSQKIARFLSLSLNTVYTYRNKFKVRAINRDSFEADVMRIGRID